MRFAVLPAVALLAFAVTPAVAATAARAPFGALVNGAPVEAITLSNSHGISARIISWGAILQSVMVPDRNGRPDEIALGFDDAPSYAASSQYFGASVGRYANRIAKGKFTLDGVRYTLAINNGVNSLHGGLKGFNRRLWTVESVKSGPDAEVVLSYISADGEEGYPGQMKVKAIYSLNEKNELKVEYRATTDKPTIVNLTNHSFFNLSGEKSQRDVYGEKLTLNASRYTPVDSTQIPTGEQRKVDGTPFDFRKATAIGARIRDGNDKQLVIGQGYDHNYIIDGTGLRVAAKLEDPWSGRVMELLVTAPGVQFYSGNFLDGSVLGRGGRLYRQGDGLAMEPQVFPDSPNHSDFPSPRLDPGTTYSNIIVYRFSTEK